MLPWDLEDWLTEEGDKAVRRQALSGDGALSDFERLIYEVWLFDTEARNGGVSQYFCNHGNSLWTDYCRAASPKLPSFSAFADAINKVVAGRQDPYEAVIESGNVLDEANAAVQARLVAELRALSGHE